jgi:hypothetical protein
VRTGCGEDATHIIEHRLEFAIRASVDGFKRAAKSDLIRPCGFHGHACDDVSAFEKFGFRHGFFSFSAKSEGIRFPSVLEIPFTTTFFLCQKKSLKKFSLSTAFMA